MYKSTTPKSLLYVCLQPTRRRIIERLSQTASYAQELARFLKLEPKVVQFHLNMLARSELISFEYGLSDDPKPVAVKRAHLTDKGGQALKMIRQITDRFEILAVPSANRERTK